jgi:type 1 glutamine amidotransferase
VIDVLVVTGGHPFEAAPFFAVFEALDGIAWSASDRPRPGHDVVVFYDMPGLQFTRGDPPVIAATPPREIVDTFDSLRDAGTGLVFVHHAIASWPAEEWFADMVGGRFHYQPAAWRGVAYPDSGYVFDVTHRVEVIDPSHPVCAGVSDGFDLTDELYCFPVAEDDVIPLMRTDFPVDDDRRFFSADLAIRGRMNDNSGWSHPPGSALVAWAKASGNSPLVYLQFGDGPVTYADPSFRRVLQNSIEWTSSSDAREWVRTRSPSG